jgi:superfamily I DNA/RNA helicase
VFDTLSEIQKNIVFEKSGKFAVRACPGSGKTYSVAARLAHKISSWTLGHQGIATISFTNAAWQEIERQITGHFKIKKPIPYPHFLGTIDSFINQFIFLPFGHLIMESNTRPTLVGPPHGIWTGRYFADSLFDNLSYDINGKPYIIRKGTVRGDLASNDKIIQVKKRLLKAGYANQDDANYFGMKVLETYPSIAQALIHRFPMIMVDEAQDTSEIQMRIIDILIENGLNDVLLVGDPDQAIFEWHDARPQLFNEKFDEWSANSIVLNENRRSSQNICNCTCRLSSLAETSIAINADVKKCHLIPTVVTYDTDDIENLVQSFIDLCCENDIAVNPDDVAIVYRSSSLFNDITGIKPIALNELPWETDNLYCKDFSKGKYLCDNDDFIGGFKLVQSAIVKKINNLLYCSSEDIERVIDKYGFINFRKEVFKFINFLPNTQSTIGEWVEKANKIFEENNIKLKFSIKRARKHQKLNELFGLDNKQITESDYRLGTIHSIKGETFEAVLVILKKKGIGKLYKTLLKENAKIEDNEELRIVYVGITRPRRLLMLAVPDDENKTAWEERLLE